VYEAVGIEERGKPTVILCNRGFVTDAKSAASSKGMPTLRIISEAIEPGRAVMADVEAEVNASLMQNVITSLTRPLTEEESSPKPKATETIDRIVFKGNLEEVNLPR
jgi:hypothetical protein